MNKLFTVLLIAFLSFGMATPAFAAKDFNIKNNTNTFLFVNGTVGNVGIGSTVPLSLLQVGVAPLIPAGSLPAEAIKGNLVVDGRIYGDGALTGLSATRVPVALNGTTIVDSGIYYVAGSVGIGSTTPGARLDVTGGVARVLSGAANPNVGYATMPGSLYVQENLEVDGNAYLGDAVTDNLTVMGTFNLTGGANYLGPVTISTTDAGALIVRKQSNGLQILNVDTIAGNVGVGTWEPGQALDVVGNVRANQIIDSGLIVDSITYAGPGGQLFGNVNLVFKGTNVGIGTALPLATVSVGAGTPNAMPPTGSDLYVKGNLEVDGKIYADGFALLNIPAGGADKEVQFNDAGLMTGASGFVYDKTSGNVGIGTITPDRLLKVSRSQNGFTDILVENMNAGNNVQARFLARNGAGYAEFGLSGNNYTAGLDQIPANTLFFWNDTGGPIVFGQDPLDAMLFISSTANVGIGTTAPASKLDVVGGVERVLSNAATANVGYATMPGSLYVQENFEVDGNVYLGDAVTDNLTVTGILTLTGGANYYSPVTISTTDASALVVRKQSSGTQIFIVDTQNSNVGIGTSAPVGLLDVNQKLTVLSGGNVGIGSTVPGQALDVVGNVRASQVIDSGLIVDSITYAGPGGQLSGNANFVFKGTNVGIGTANPEYALDIGGSGVLNIGGGALRFGTTKIMGFSGSALQLNAKAPGGSVQIVDYTTAVPLVTFKDSGNVGIGTIAPLAKLAVAGVGTTTARAFEIDDSLYNPKVVVFDNGNVGIGSTTPESKLDVKGGVARVISGVSNPNVGYATTPGSLYVQDNLEVDGNVYLGDATTDNLTVLGTLSLTGGANYFSPVTISTTDASALVVRKQSSGAQIFIVDTQNSNVGIGTSAPVGLLDVNQKLTVLSGGNVGIGSTVPGQALDVVGNVRASQVIDSGLIVDSITYAGPGGQLFGNANFVFKGTNVGIGTSVPLAHLQVGTGSPTMALTTPLGVNDALVKGRLEVDGTVYINGNVGIGTTSPNLDLDLVRNVNSQAYIGVTNFNSGASAYAGLLARNDVAAGDASLLVLSSGYAVSGLNVPNRAKFRSGAGLINGFAFGTAVGPAIFFTADTERVRIDSIGNVGIGTIAPFAKLVVAGVGIATARAFEVDDNLYNPKFSVLDNGNVGIGSTLPLATVSVGAGTPNAMPPTGSDLYVKGNIEVDGKIYADGFSLTNIPAGGANMQVQYNDAGLMTGASGFVFDKTSGNVGVGSAAPGSRLDVKGGVARILSGVSNPNVGYATTPGSLYVQDNLEVDGNVYLGDAVADNLIVTGVLSLTGGANYYSPVTISTTDASAFVVRKQSSGAQVFIVDTQNSNVGIGTSAPVGLLDVNQKLTVLSSGNVGIGTVVPTHLLEVAGDISVTGSSDSYFMSNVGVGTSVPAYKLDVVGTLNATGAVTLGSTLGVTGTIDVNGGGTNDIAGTLNLSGNALTSSGALTITPAATNNLNVVLSGAGDFVVNTNQLYVDTSAGNVGIGTAAPRAKFDVEGPIFMGQIATPTPATDRLYNTGGNLFWSGSPVAIGSALIWNVVSGTSQTMSVNNGYVANNAALVTITLPATAAAGTVVAVTGGLSGAGGWKIAQNAGQTIHFGSVVTTAGVTGYLSSNNQFDGVQMVCVSANTDFVVIASQGNITYF